VTATAPKLNAPSKIAKNRSRLSGLSSMPRRIFTVSGTPGGSASRTRPTIERAVSRIAQQKAAAASAPATFFTGQAKFKSITSKPADTSFSAAGGNCSGQRAHQLRAPAGMFVRR